MQNRLTPFVWSVMAAVAIVIVLAVVLLVTMLLSRGGEIIEETVESAEEAEPTDCTFTGLAGQLMVYQAPVAVPSQQQVTVLGSENYPIVSQRDDMYLIQFSDSSGWVLGPEGTLQGDCEDIPRDDRPLSEFPTVCTVTTEAAKPLYSEIELVNEMQTLQPGTYVVDAIENDRYLVLLDDGIAGWILSGEGQLIGACDVLANPPQ